MQSEDINDYLIPRENPGDAVFIGDQQESLSAEQEKALRLLVRQVRANCKAGEVKDLERLFDTSDPRSKKFQEALIRDAEENPDMYKKDIIEAEINQINKVADTKEKEGSNTWGNGVLNVLKSAASITYGAFTGAWFNHLFGNTVQT